MPLTPVQTLLMILAITVGTVLTRFLPFWLFPQGKEPPRAVVFLGTALPPAMMGLLVVYCLKSVNPLSFPFALPEAAAILCIVILHLWKRNVLLSIGAGTIVYMILLRILGI